MFGLRIELFEGGVLGFFVFVFLVLISVSLEEGSSKW